MGLGESSGVGSDPVSQRCSHVVVLILNHDFIALANGLAEQNLLSCELSSTACPAPSVSTTVPAGQLHIKCRKNCNEVLVLISNLSTTY